MTENTSSNSYARKAAAHQGSSLIPDGLSQNMLAFWLDSYARSAEGFNKDEKVNLAESCAYIALRYIKKARESGVEEIFVDGKRVPLDNLEAKMMRIKPSPAALN